MSNQQDPPIVVTGGDSAQDPSVSGAGAAWWEPIPVPGGALPLDPPISGGDDAS
jgi:hypothetical protein